MAWLWSWIHRPRDGGRAERGQAPGEPAAVPKQVEVLVVLAAEAAMAYVQQ